jgi:hypothetical protein
MMVRFAQTVALGAAALLAAAPARAQAPISGAIDQLEPTPAGDAFFGVPSPAAGGHLVPRALVMFDYADQPLSLTTGETTSTIVGSQAFLHLGVSLALWDRLLVSMLLPIAVLQNGDSPMVQGVTLQSPSSAEVGDLRLGARVRLFGEYDAPFQIGAGAYLHLPTGPSDSFTGEGTVRAGPQIVLGGRIDRFVWSAAIGAAFRGSENPSTLTYGAGAAVMLLQDRIQAGAELFAATPLQEGFITVSETSSFSRGMTTNAELLLGVRARLVEGLVLGVAAGPGLTDAIGTPTYRFLGNASWAPLPPKPKAASLDTDEDGILDASDACPYAHGPHHENPRRAGCPVQDRDDDGVADPDDVCPDAAGVAGADTKQRGCPADRDGDAVPDALDACPDQKAEGSADGCPAPAPVTPAPAAPAPATP